MSDFKRRLVKICDEYFEDNFNILNIEDDLVPLRNDLYDRLDDFYPRASLDLTTDPGRLIVWADEAPHIRGDSWFVVYEVRGRRLRRARVVQGTDLDYV